MSYVRIYRMWLEEEEEPQLAANSYYNLPTVDIIRKQGEAASECIQAAIDNGILERIEKPDVATMQITGLHCLGTSLKEAMKIVRLLHNEYQVKEIGYSKYFCFDTPGGHMYWRSVNLDELISFHNAFDAMNLVKLQEGRKKAAAEGRTLGGRKPKYNQQQKDDAFALMASEGLTLKELVKRTGMSKSTLDRENRERRKRGNEQQP